jgi:hypothetical protein
MFHCHKLVHEDHDMMVRFEVGTGGHDPITTDLARSRPQRARSRGLGLDSTPSSAASESFRVVLSCGLHFLRRYGLSGQRAVRLGQSGGGLIGRHSRQQSDGGRAFSRVALASAWLLGLRSLAGRIRARGSVAVVCKEPHGCLRERPTGDARRRG